MLVRNPRRPIFPLPRWGSSRGEGDFEASSPLLVPASAILSHAIPARPRLAAGRRHPVGELARDASMVYPRVRAILSRLLGAPPVQARDEPRLATLASCRESPTSDGMQLPVTAVGSIGDITS